MWWLALAFLPRARIRLVVEVVVVSLTALSTLSTLSTFSTFSLPETAVVVELISLGLPRPCEAVAVFLVRVDGMNLQHRCVCSVLSLTTERTVGDSDTHIVE